MKIKRKGRTPDQLHSEWYEAFLKVIEENPRIKDPAYVAWLAQLSFVAMEKGLKAPDMATNLGVSRSHVYQLFDGVYTARQDVMERAAMKIGACSIEEFRQRGYDLLGGQEAVEKIMRFIYIKKMVAGVSQDGQVITEESYTQDIWLPREQYQSSWGPMAKLAMITNDWGVFLVNLETSAAAISGTHYALVLTPEGTLSRVETCKVSDNSMIRGVFIEPPSTGWRVSPTDSRVTEAKRLAEAQAQEAMRLAKVEALEAKHKRLAERLARRSAAVEALEAKRLAKAKLWEAKRSLLVEALEANKGNRMRTAEALGISYPALQGRLKRFGLVK